MALDCGFFCLFVFFGVTKAIQSLVKARVSLEQTGSWVHTEARLSHSQEVSCSSCPDTGILPRRLQLSRCPGAGRRQWEGRAVPGPSSGSVRDWVGWQSSLGWLWPRNVLRARWLGGRRCWPARGCPPGDILC